MREVKFLYFDNNKEMFVSKQNVSHFVPESSKISKSYIDKLDALGSFASIDEIIAEILNCNCSNTIENFALDNTIYEFLDIENDIIYSVLGKKTVKKTIKHKNSFNRRIVYRTSTMNGYTIPSKQMSYKYLLLAILHEVKGNKIRLDDRIKKCAKKLIERLEGDLKDFNSASAQVRVLDLIGDHIVNNLLKPAEENV